jgi:hypothetical protein
MASTLAIKLAIKLATVVTTTSSILTLLSANTAIASHIKFENSHRETTLSLAIAPNQTENQTEQISGENVVDLGQLNRIIQADQNIAIPWEIAVLTKDVILLEPVKTPLVSLVYVSDSVAFDSVALVNAPGNREIIKDGQEYLDNSGFFEAVILEISLIDISEK